MQQITKIEKIKKFCIKTFGKICLYGLKILKKINYRILVPIIIFFIFVLLLAIFVKIELKVGLNDIINWFVGIIVLSYIGEYLNNNRSNKEILLSKISDIGNLLEELVKYIERLDDEISEKDIIWIFFNINLSDNRIKHILDNCNNKINDNEVNELKISYASFRGSVTNDLRSIEFNMQVYKQKVYLKYFDLESKINELDLKINS